MAEKVRSISCSDNDNSTLIASTSDFINDILNNSTIILENNSLSTIMNASQLSNESQPQQSITSSQQKLNISHNIGGTTTCRFPKLDECAHFHYERVQLGQLRVRLIDDNNKRQQQEQQDLQNDTASSISSYTIGHNITNNVLYNNKTININNYWFIIKVTAGRSDTFLIKRSLDNLKMLDELLHRCVYDRKISGLRNLKDIDDEVDDCLENIVGMYLNRFTMIASDSITCGPVLTWLQLDNKGRRLPVADLDTMKTINTPAVGAAYGVRRYVAQACDEISIEVGDMISVIDMPSPAESVWWRGKKSHLQKSQYEVGFFPQSCVATIGDKVPRHLPLPAPLVGSLALSPTKPVLRKHGKLIAFFRSFILSRPSRRRLKQSGIYKERVFSCDLGEHLLNSGQDIPMVLKCCAEFIEEYGIVDGIYRLSGITSNIQKLRRAFDEERIPDLTHPDIKQDIHAVSSLLKMYFRELPNPLCTYQLYDHFVDAIQSRSDGDNLRLKLMKETVQKLPPPHYRTLKYLAMHLHKISRHSANTGMTDRNLAIVWAPNLLRSPALESGGVAALRGVGVQAVVTEYLITNCDLIFDPNDEFGGLRYNQDSQQLMDSLTDTESLKLPDDREHEQQSLSIIERPKSLSVGGAKLLSLEEAQIRHNRLENVDKGIPIIQPGPHSSSYIEVGGGPSSLPDKYHTVLPVPRSWQKRKTHSWKSLFSRAPRQSNSNHDIKTFSPTTPTSKNLPKDDDHCTVIRLHGDSVSGEDKLNSHVHLSASTGSQPKELKCGDIYDGKSNNNMDICVRTGSVDSLRTAGHSRSVSHDSYFDLLQSPLRAGVQCPSRELSELGLNFDREEPEMRIFSESESLVSSPKKVKETTRRVMRARPEEYSSTANSVNPSPKKQPRLNLQNASGDTTFVPTTDNSTHATVSWSNAHCENNDESLCKRYKLEDQFSDIQFIDCSTPEHTINGANVSSNHSGNTVYTSVQIHQPPTSASSSRDSLQIEIRGKSDESENSAKKINITFKNNYRTKAQYDKSEDNGHDGIINTRYSFPGFQYKESGDNNENERIFNNEGRFSYPGGSQASSNAGNKYYNDKIIDFQNGKNNKSLKMNIEDEHKEENNDLMGSFSINTDNNCRLYNNSQTNNKTISKNVAVKQSVPIITSKTSTTTGRYSYNDTHNYNNSNNHNINYKSNNNNNKSYDINRHSTDLSYYQQNQTHRSNSAEQLRLHEKNSKNDLDNSKLSIITPQSPIQSPRYSLLLGETSSENSSSLNTPIYDQDMSSSINSTNYCNINKTTDDDNLIYLTDLINDSKDINLISTTSINEPYCIRNDKRIEKRDIATIKRELSLDLDTVTSRDKTTKICIDLTDGGGVNGNSSQLITKHIINIPSTPNTPNHTITSDNTSQSITPSEYCYQHLNRQSSLENSPIKVYTEKINHPLDQVYFTGNNCENINRPTIVGMSPVRTSVPTTPIKSTINITYNLKSPVKTDSNEEYSVENNEDQNNDYIDHIEKKLNSDDCLTNVNANHTNNDYENVIIHQENKMQPLALLETSFDENMVYEQVKFFKNAVSEVNNILENNISITDSNDYNINKYENDINYDTTSQVVPDIEINRNISENDIQVTKPNSNIPSSSTSESSKNGLSMENDTMENIVHCIDVIEDIQMSEHGYDIQDSLEFDQNLSLYENINLRKPRQILYENVDIIPNAKEILNKNECDNIKLDSYNDDENIQMDYKNETSVVEAPQNTHHQQEQLDQHNKDGRRNNFIVKQLATKFETSPVDAMPPFDFSRPFLRKSSVNDNTSNNNNCSSPCVVRAKNNKQLNKSIKITRSLDENAFIREFGNKKKFENVNKSTQQINHNIDDNIKLNDNIICRRKSLEFTRPKCLNPPKHLPNLENTVEEICKNNSEATNITTMCLIEPTPGKLKLDFSKVTNDVVDDFTETINYQVKITPTTENRISLIQNNVIDSLNNKNSDDDRSSTSSISSIKVLGSCKLDRERIEKIKEERRLQLNERFRSESFRGEKEYNRLKSKSKTELNEYKNDRNNIMQTTDNTADIIRCKSKSKPDINLMLLTESNNLIKEEPIIPTLVKTSIMNSQSLTTTSNYQRNRQIDDLNDSKANTATFINNIRNNITTPVATTALLLNDTKTDNSKPIHGQLRNTKLEISRERDSNFSAKKNPQSSVTERDRISPQRSIRDVAAIFESKSHQNS